MPRAQAWGFRALLLVSLSSALAGSSSNVVEQCLSAGAFFKSLQERRSRDPLPRLDDEFDLLAREYTTSDGKMVSRYSAKHRTRFYRTLPARAQADGTMPLTDPDTEGVFLFFHGSGTAKAGGRNFVHQINSLGDMGYSAVGFDMPFHSDGPLDESFNDAGYFMKWLAGIVDDVRVPGKPVYLAGHSFGPDVIAEFIRRYPDKADGAVLISPATFNSELRAWYEKYTSKMNFGDTAENALGGEWADKISRQLTWAEPGPPSKDPTVVNPKLRVRVLAGDHEEYMPGPVVKDGRHFKVGGKNTYDLCAQLRKLMRNIECTIEKGIGHYIFQHADKNGVNVIMRELLAINGKTPADIAKLQERYKARLELLSPFDNFARRYEQDALFRVWVDEEVAKPRLQNWIANRNERFFESLLSRFDKEWLPAQFKRLVERIKATEREHPAFYAEYKTEIDALGKPNANPNKIYSRYFDYLKRLRLNED